MYLIPLILCIDNRMNKELTKRQHWNPRMHLKHFSTDGKVYLYDKKTSSVKQVSINDVAVGNWFYDRDNSIEEKLSKIESKVDKIFLKIIRKKHIYHISLEERKYLNEFIVLQDYRTPHSRKMFEIIYHEYLQLFLNASKNGKIDESLIPEGLPKDLWENIPPPKENFLKFLQMIKDDPNYFVKFNKEGAVRVTNMIIKGIIPSGIKLFGKLKMRLFNNTSDLDFYTSDHPVCRYNHYMIDKYGYITMHGIGYDSEGIQFFYPLAPKLSLVFEDGKRYNNFKDVTVVDHKFVEFVNARIIQNSNRWLFSQNSNFNYADELLGDYPDFRDSAVLFGLWKIAKTDSDRSIWERFYGVESQRRLEKYIEHLIQNGATEREVKEIRIKYNLEYIKALDNEKKENSFLSKQEN